MIASGQPNDAKPLLDEAQGYANQLQNADLTAQLHTVLAEELFYRGDFKGARTRFQHVLEVATKGKIRMFELSSRLALAKVDIAEGRPQSAVPALQKMLREGNQGGLAYFAAECGLYLGEALSRLGRHGAAEEQLNTAFSQAERLGALVLMAKAHRLLALSEEASGKTADARRHLESARRVLEQIRREARTDDVLKRADLKALIAEPAE